MLFRSRACVTLTAHGNDSGDKAPGKVMSYAVKTTMLKLFGIETGENDESRNFDANAYTDEQKEIFDDLIASNNALGMHCYMTMLGEGLYINLYNSFKTDKQKNKKLVSSLMDTGRAEALTLAEQIMQRIDENDPSVTELTDELEGYEKIVVSNMLRATDINHLKKLKTV